MSPETAQWLYRFGNEANFGIPWWVLSALGAALLAGWSYIEFLSGIATRSRFTAFVGRVLGLALGSVLLVVGILKLPGFLGLIFFQESLLEDRIYPTEWFQSVNPLFIVVLAPLFASMWLWLRRRGWEPTTPIKFALGLILLGCGFVFMVLGSLASQADGADQIVRVSGFWLIGAYFVFTCGELCLSPVGLSAVTKLAPAKFVSLLMGVWFLSNFISNLLAGILGGYNEHIQILLPGLAGFFVLFVIAPVAAGIVVLFLAPVLNKLMHGRA